MMGSIPLNTLQRNMIIREDVVTSLRRFAYAPAICMRRMRQLVAGFSTLTRVPLYEVSMFRSKPRSEPSRSTSENFSVTRYTTRGGGSSDPQLYVQQRTACSYRYR